MGAPAKKSEQKENTWLAGRYEVLSFIGSGVTSKVYKAIDRKFNKTVAVKMLNQFLATDPVSIERFKREAQITRVLLHSQIATITDIFKFQGQLFLIMDYAEGIGLKEYIHLNAPLDTNIAADIIEQLLSVMSVCHAKNIIHRDIKPQNIVIGPDNRITLLDFGIARMTSLSDLTQTGTSLGTPEYMAPELYATSTYDPRTDLYAIGVIGYELLTGQLPFQGDTIAVLYTHHLHGSITPPKAVKSDIPQWLSDLIIRLLAKLPYQRYQTADECLKDLKNKRVLLKDIPNLKHIHCFACGEQTFAEVSICTCCGADRNSLFLSGGTSLRTTDNVDGKKLKQFLAKTLRIPTNKMKIYKQQLLIKNVSPQTSAMIKTLAMKEGLYLKNSDDFIDHRIKFYILGAPLLLLFLKDAFGLLFYFRSGLPVFGITCYLVVLNYCRISLKRHTPVITESQIEKQDIKLQISTSIKRFFSNKNVSSDLRELMKQLIRKHVLILNAGVEKSSGHKRQLSELTSTAAEIAEHMGLIQSEMHSFDPRVAMEMLEDAQEAIKECKTEQDKVEKERIYVAILQALQKYQNEEEALSRLNNKLIQINAAFNQLTAQSCVLKLPIDEATMELFKRLNDDLKQQHNLDGRDHNEHNKHIEQSGEVG